MIDMRSLHAGMMLGAWLISTGWELDFPRIAKMLRSYNEFHKQGTPLSEKEIEEILGYIKFYEGIGAIKP